MLQAVSFIQGHDLEKQNEVLGHETHGIETMEKEIGGQMLISMQHSTSKLQEAAQMVQCVSYNGIKQVASITALRTSSPLRLVC